MRIAAIIALVLIVAGSGCRPSEPPKYPVAGVVQFNDQPIENGTMTLIPKSPQARTTVGEIVNGKYAMEVTAGDWTVNIQAVREKGLPDPNGGEVPREQYIPAKYNSDSSTIITVPSDQTEFDYDLEP